MKETVTVWQVVVVETFNLSGKFEYLLKIGTIHIKGIPSPLINQKKPKQNKHILEYLSTYLHSLSSTNKQQGTYLRIGER